MSQRGIPILVLCWMIGLFPGCFPLDVREPTEVIEAPKGSKKGKKEAIPVQKESKRRGYTETGKASYYHTKYHLKETASGERFDQNAKMAAHQQLPFDTRVRVTNVKNNRSVVVRIVDRGPFAKGRIIDLSKSAFRQIADIDAGVIQVGIKVLE